MASLSSLAAIVAVLVMAVVTETAQAQAQTCASNLVPCGPYLNATTKPPNSCCDLIKETAANDLPCLCNLYQNPGFLSGLGINVAQALRLPHLCDIPSDASACNSAASAAPTGSNTQPPPGSTPGGNCAGKIASSGVVGLVLVSACMMLLKNKL